MSEKVKYCECENISSISTEFNDFYQWDVCNNCNLPIEGTIQGLNHYDGEDHTFEY